MSDIAREAACTSAIAALWQVAFRMEHGRKPNKNIRDAMEAALPQAVRAGLAEADRCDERNGIIRQLVIPMEV